MYSEQELTKIIGEVFDQKIEAGAFNESIADAVDAYLAEHPIDITALEGLDISVGSLTSTGAISGASLAISGNASVGGNLPVTGNITAASIIENMSGYSFIPATKENVTATQIYSGVVKNGNKLTYVLFLQLKRTGTVANGFFNAGDFVLPATVMSGLYPYTLTGLSNVLCDKIVDAFSAVNAAPKQLYLMVSKQSGYVSNILYGMGNLDVDTDYMVRIEVTFLLSDNLAA